MEKFAESLKPYLDKGMSLEDAVRAWKRDEDTAYVRRTKNLKALTKSLSGTYDEFRKKAAL